MGFQLFQLPKQQNMGANLTVLPLAKVYFYASGTETLQAIYQDHELSEVHPNPVVADTSGALPPIYLDATLRYGIAVKTAGGRLIYEADPANDQIELQSLTQAQLSAFSVATSVAGTNTITANLTPAAVAYTNAMRVTFKPVADNTGATTIALNGLSAVSILKGTGTSGASTTALVAGDLLTSFPAEMISNGSAFILLNPQTEVTPLSWLDLIINNAPFQRTAAEIAVGVTPVNYFRPEGHVERYGTNTTPGTTDMTAAIEAAFAVSDEDGVVGVVFDPATYLTDALAIDNATVVPAFVDGRGATLESRTVALSSYLLSITNPHGKRDNFEIRNLVLNGADKTKTFRQHGGQGGTYRNIRVINSTGIGFDFNGELGYGIYHNLYENLHAGEFGAENNGIGFNEDGGAGPSFFMNNNTFLNCRAQFNKGDGWKTNYANNDHYGCEAEKNDGYGANHDNTTAVGWYGGYMENNHQNWASGGASDLTTDSNFNGTANTTCWRVFGGRFIGTPQGTWSGQGNWYQPGNVSVITMPHLDPNTGQLSVNAIRVFAGGGIGVAGANAIDNTINFSAGSTAAIALSGTNAVVLTSSLITARLPLAINDTNARITAGSGSPEGAVTAAVGSFYLRTNGASNSAAYLKVSGSGNTGWEPIDTTP